MIVPIGGILLVVRLSNKQSIQVCFGGTREIGGLGRRAVLIAFLVPVLALGVAVSIWASYGFRYSMLNPAVGEATEPIPWDDAGSHAWGVNRAIFLARAHHWLPEAYLYGFSFVMHHSEARNAFLTGEFRRFGWISFFPYCLATKTPLELFVLLGMAGGALWFHRGQRSGAELSLNRESTPAESGRPAAETVCNGLLYDLTPLLTLFLVYWVVALASRLNIGHRHLLPTYPAMMILAGAAAGWFRSPSPGSVTASSGGTKIVRNTAGAALRTMRLLVVAAVGLYAVEGVWIWPHYLAYFNVLVGGPRHGYKHLVDSSLDWSQDLKGVKTWLDAHPADARDQRRLYFSFYGSPPPEYYGIRVQRLPSFPFRWQPHSPEPLTGGTYLISATMLERSMLADAGRWNREYESRYQNLRSNVEVYQKLSGTADGKAQLYSVAPEQEWQDMFKTYEVLRFSRLASFLCQREPDDQIGYSIMVYRLTQEDLDRAVDGPPVEMLDAPEWMIEDQRLGRNQPNEG